MVPSFDTKHAQGTSESDFLELDWQFFGELCRVLAVKVATSGFYPDVVVGIAKAGVIPGAVVASILRCDFYSLRISRDSGGERVRERPEILSAAPREAAGKRVLVVDEICTSGDTMRIALNALRQVGPADVRTAVSLVKGTAFKPDYHALETTATVVFPWDRHILDDAGNIIENPMYDGHA